MYVLWLLQGPDVPQGSETPYDESGDGQVIHGEKDMSPSPIQEEEPQLTFR